MRNLPFIIVTSMLIALLLAVGIWSRNYAPGPQRSIQFGNDLKISTGLTDPVAVIVQLQNPDGTVTPLAWASLGAVEGTMTTSGVTFPASGVLVIQFASGMSLVQGVGAPSPPIVTSNSIGAGPATAGVAMAPIAGLGVNLNGTTNVVIQPGFTAEVEINADGATTNMRVPATASRSAPPPAPPALPPPPVKK